MNNKNHATHLKREVLIRLIQSFFSEDFTEKVNKIPFEMRPKNSEVPYRCCIYKERAILRARTIASLGGSIREDDEVKPLSSYAQDAVDRVELPKKALTIVDTACHACKPSKVFVTDLCQGCVARPCVSSCNFGAISIVNGKSVVDEEKCVKCGMCIKACPYQAIVKSIVPCENACPVGAIQKKEDGVAQIDFDKCISCGACVSTCPFGAVAEKSQIIDILKQIKVGKKVVAMVAPSVVGQMPASINQIATALVKAGFSTVYEVAQGADITTKHEAEDFKERMEQGDEFMTTSCCAAYNELVEKHVPELEPFVSETLTPLAYTAQIAKEDYPECISVFVGPCVAKRKEGHKDDNVDFVMSFEEMGALFVAKHIEVADCDDYEFPAESSTQGRGFANTAGVSGAVNSILDDDSKAKPVLVDGLDKKAIRDLKTYAKNGKCPLGNMIEVMACCGGCVGGSSVLNEKKVSSKKVKQYADDGNLLNKE